LDLILLLIVHLLIRQCYNFGLGLIYFVRNVAIETEQAFIEWDAGSASQETEVNGN